MKPPKLDYHGLMDDQHINSKNMIFYNNILKMMIQIQSNLKYIWRDDIVIILYSDFVSAKVRFKIYNSGSRNKLRTDDLETNPQLRVQPLGMLYISCFVAVGNQHSTTGRKPHQHPWGSTNLNGLCVQMTQWPNGPSKYKRRVTLAETRISWKRALQACWRAGIGISWNFDIVLNENTMRPTRYGQSPC